MFNFFNEIKNKIGFKEDLLNDYTLVNIDGKALYAEGHKGIIALSKERVVFRIKRGQIAVEGSGLIMAELQENTLLIQGQIDKIERLY